MSSWVTKLKSDPTTCCFIHWSTFSFNSGLKWFFQSPVFPMFTHLLIDVWLLYMKYMNSTYLYGRIQHLYLVPASRPWWIPRKLVAGTEYCHFWTDYRISNSCSIWPFGHLSQIWSRNGQLSLSPFLNPILLFKWFNINLLLA